MVNALILAVASGWVLHVTLPAQPASSAMPPEITAGSPSTSPSPSTAPSPTPTATQRPVPLTVLTKADLLKVSTDRQHFGLSTPRSPFNKSELDRATSAAGIAPTLIEYFTKWTENYRPGASTACYARGAIPVISWEPWAGEQAGKDQPKYSLASIANGDHDAYITKFATAVRNDRRPIIIRFAHEMNGIWYPWAEIHSGNHRGDYVQAWRHVHDVFNRIGATNVIWVWSPNIVRPVPKVQLAPLYPGDAYVDWIGMVGYGAHETTAGAVFDPTLQRMRAFTGKPVLITETATQPLPSQPGWTADLFNWLKQHPDVVGFVWFEYNKAGATADWRFSRDNATRAAFRAGLARTDLVPPLRY